MLLVQAAEGYHPHPGREVAGPDVTRIAGTSPAPAPGPAPRAPRPAAPPPPPPAGRSALDLVGVGEAAWRAAESRQHLSGKGRPAPPEGAGVQALLGGDGGLARRPALSQLGGVTAPHPPAYAQSTVRAPLPRAPRQSAGGGQGGPGASVGRSCGGGSAPRSPECQVSPGGGVWRAGERPHPSNTPLPKQSHLVPCPPRWCGPPRRRLLLPDGKYKRKMRQCPGPGSPSPRDGEMKSRPN